MQGCTPAPFGLCGGGWFAGPGGEIPAPYAPPVTRTRPNLSLGRGQPRSTPVGPCCLDWAGVFCCSLGQWPQTQRCHRSFPRAAGQARQGRVSQTELLPWDLEPLRHSWDLVQTHQAEKTATLPHPTF